MSRMTVHPFHRAALRPTPWKNGRGSTLEAVCEPAGAGTADFEWRVSIATVDAAGPFSTFPGVDRNITLLHGAGMRLHSPDAGLDHALSEVLQPFDFPGEIPLHATPLGGASEDFNVMTRRSLWRSEVRVIRRKEDVSACDRTVWFAALGEWQVDLPGEHLVRLQAGGGCWLSTAMPGAVVQPVGALPPALIAVQLWSNT